MKKRIKKEGSHTHLLTGYLEEIAGEVFERYPTALKAVIRRQSGVYALYKDRNLYYVGLASNLMGRLQNHLRDRHANRWNRFSVYLTREDGHMRQLEALLLRISKPMGNRVKGGLKGSKNMYPDLRYSMTEIDADNRARLLGGSGLRQRRRRKARDGKGSVVLAGLVERRIPLRAEFRGALHRASLRKDGRIALKGRVYDSPSAAAKAIVGRAANGWTFWTYRHGARDWRRLKELRR